jgi:hypothetical protein
LVTPTTTILKYKGTISGKEMNSYGFTKVQQDLIWSLLGKELVFMQRELSEQDGVGYAKKREKPNEIDTQC